MTGSKGTACSLKSFPLGSFLYSCALASLVSFLQSDLSRHTFHCLKDEGDEVGEGNAQ